MTKYKTKPIDYTGCDPVIAEHLKKGESIKCCFPDREDLGQQYISYFDAGSPFPYRFIHHNGTYDGWTKAAPVTTVTKVKKASEIMKWLKDNNYKVDDKGNWYRATSRYGSFISDRWKYCGCQPDEYFSWHPAWLEEVDDD